MLEKIKEANVRESNGQKSLSIKTETNSGLMTANYIQNDLGGKIPVYEIGKEYDLEFSVIQKKDGSGTWTSVHDKSLEVKKSGSTSGGGGNFKGGYSSQKPQEDPISKIINSCLMSCSTIFASVPQELDADFIKFFSTVTDAAVAKWVEHKGK